MAKFNVGDKVQSKNGWICFSSAIVRIAEPDSRGRIVLEFVPNENPNNIVYDHWNEKTLELVPSSLEEIVLEWYDARHIQGGHVKYMKSISALEEFAKQLKEKE